MKRPLVFFSPLPPLRNGIADYSAGFLGELADQYDLYAVIANDAPACELAGVTALTMSEYEHHRAAFRPCAHAYQIGNNLDHRYILPALSEVPGLVTVHDLSIQHMIAASLADSVVGETYFELMFEAYGADGLEIARDVPRWRRQSPIVHTELGFMPILLRRAAGIVTHSRTGVMRAAASGIDRPTFYIPHPYQPRLDAIAIDRDRSRARARALLGLPADAIILLSLGFVTQAKQVHLVLEALSRIEQRDRRIVFVVAGEMRPEEVDVPGHVERLGLGEQVILRGYVPDEMMAHYFAACDVLVNLRLPSLGESSGSLASGLGVGCCILVTDIGTFSELPDACAVKVPVAEMTVDGVVHRLLPLLAAPERRRLYEANARKFACETLRMDDFVAAYVAAIEQTLFPAAVHQIPAGFVARRMHLKTARASVERNALALAAAGDPARATMWWRELLLPLDADGALRIEGGGRFEEELAREAFGWSRIDPVDADAPPGGASSDASAYLAILPAGAFGDDPGAVLVRAAAHLAMGGTLVLNLIGADIPDPRWYGAAADAGATRLSRPWTSAIARLFEQHGFALERAISCFCEVSGFPAGPQQELLFTGQKMSDVARPAARPPREQRLRGAVPGADG